MKLRQDAWGKEHDALLAELVLKHIREGSTQLNAFEEAGDRLNRTAAACGFRWNAIIRQQYVEAMEAARKERKQRSRLNAKQTAQAKKLSSFSFQENAESGSAAISMKEVIAYLLQFSSENDIHVLQNENAKLRSELEKAAQEHQKLESELEELKTFAFSMQEDYESLLKIMERARKLAAFAEEPPAPVKFKMERNGNLEKMAE